MNKLLRCIISIVLLAYLVIAVAWARSMASEARCQGVDIIVTDTLRTQFVTAPEIAREIGDLPRHARGMRLDSINTDSIEAILSKIDKIESARCIVTTDGLIRIEVDPMLPVARIFTASSSYYINKDGKRISANARYHSDVPVVSGQFDSVFGAKDILPLIKYIDSDSTWSNLITHIKVESPRNIILVPIIHGHVINIGDQNDLEDKFYRLERAYKEVLPVKGWDFYDTLTVKWGGQLVATRRVKKLHHAISAVDLDAERELPDIGTMLVGDSAGVAVEHKSRKKPAN